MSTPMELVVSELDAETAQLLPERSALGFLNLSFIDVYAVSDATSFFSFWSETEAETEVDIDVDQD